MAERLKIPFDQASQYHPEYDGYVKGASLPADSSFADIYDTVASICVILTGYPVKQADTVMLGYPLGFQMPLEVRKNDLEVYEPVTDPNGPAMTWVRADPLHNRGKSMSHFCHLSSHHIKKLQLIKLKFKDPYSAGATFCTTLGLSVFTVYLNLFSCPEQSMFAIGWLELGDTDKAQLLLQKCFQNIQGPFQVSWCRPPWQGLSAG